MRGRPLFSNRDGFMELVRSTTASTVGARLFRATSSAAAPRSVEALLKWSKRWLPCRRCLSVSALVNEEGEVVVDAEEIKACPARKWQGTFAAKVAE